MTSKKDVVSAIISSFEIDPDNWVFSDYALKNKKTHFNIWVGSGFWFLKVQNPVPLEINFFQRLRLNKAIKSLGSRKCLLAIQGEPGGV